MRHNPSLGAARLASVADRMDKEHYSSTRLRRDVVRVVTLFTTASVFLGGEAQRYTEIIARYDTRAGGGYRMLAHLTERAKTLFARATELMEEIKHESRAFRQAGHDAAVGVARAKSLRTRCAMKKRIVRRVSTSKSARGRTSSLALPRDVDGVQWTDTRIGSTERRRAGSGIDIERTVCLADSLSLIRSRAGDKPNEIREHYEFPPSLRALWKHSTSRMRARRVSMACLQSTEAG